MKNPAVAAGGAAAGLENPGLKGPEGDSDMAVDKPGQQERTRIWTRGSSDGRGGARRLLA